MVSNEQLIARELEHTKDYDVFQWSSPAATRTFAVANDLYGCFFHLYIGHLELQDDLLDAYVLSLQLVYLGHALTPAVETNEVVAVRKERAITDVGPSPAILVVPFAEWVEFPVRLGDLPMDAVLHVELRGAMGNKRVAVATVHPYTTTGQLKTGGRYYTLYAEGAVPETMARDADPAVPWQQAADDLRCGVLPAVPWLDRITTACLEDMRLEAAASVQPMTDGDSSSSSSSTSLARGMLHVRFPLPSLRTPLYHLDLPYTVAPPAWVATAASEVGGRGAPFQDAYHFAKEHNLSEARAALLSKSMLLSGSSNTTPGPRERKRLLQMVVRPPLQLEPLRTEEVGLLWRYRFFIQRDSRFFLLFMQHVDWQANTLERRLAMEMLLTARTLQLPDLLGCLSFTFRRVLAVRRYAIAQMSSVSDELLCHFFFPLLQAIQYDDPSERELAHYLVLRALGHWELCCALWWAVRVESQLRTTAGDHMPFYLMEEEMSFLLQQQRPIFWRRLKAQQDLITSFRELTDKVVAATSFNRLKRVESGKQLLKKHKTRLQQVLKDAQNTLTAPTHPRVLLRRVKTDSFYIFKSATAPFRLDFMASLPTTTTTTTTTEEEREEEEGELVFRPLACPPVPTTFVDMVPAASSLTLGLIFKAKDDVRQDQLVLQLIQVMDTALRQDGLDLGLTIYRVTATGPDSGFVEMVPGAVTLQSVQYDVKGFLQGHNKSTHAMRQAMERYMKSLAGYSVISFVLGLGDRHLENILMTPDGRLLHIDFSYILGNDPKPFQPPMKINREMIEALGGPESSNYLSFLSYCCGTYNTIRKHAALVLQLLQLTVHARGMPQLTPATVAGREVDPRTNIMKVQDRLRLDLNNAQATQYIQQVIADSVGSVFTNLWDVLHVAAQVTRA